MPSWELWHLGEGSTLGVRHLGVSFPQGSLKTACTLLGENMNTSLLSIPSGKTNISFEYGRKTEGEFYIQLEIVELHSDLVGTAYTAMTKAGRVLSVA